MEPWEGKTIVIVDDMPQVLERLSILYKQIGLNVVGVALDGVEALALVKDKKPDLVSLDIIMPEMDGIECFRKMRDSPELDGIRPKAFFISYLSTEPKILDAYRQEIPEYLFIPKTYAPEPIKSTLVKIYGTEANQTTPKLPSSNEKDSGPSVGL